MEERGGMETGGLVVNLRGTSGAGKTELVRRLIGLYSGAQVGAAGTALTRHGRTRPIVWVLPHPAGGRPLAVLGDYDGGAARGGCDTIPLRDGGMAEAFRLADDLARDGHDVLLEGLALSADVRDTAALAAAGRRVHVLCLATPLEECVRNVVRRRRAGAAALPAIRRTAEAGQLGLEAAVAALRTAPAIAEVGVLAFDDLLARARALLGLPRTDTRALNGAVSAGLRDDDSGRRGSNPAWMAAAVKLRRG
jgi:hypothetical protein